MKSKLLQHAVQHLYGKGLIAKDKDISDKTGYNKSTVSSYIGGKAEPSDEFITKFEKAFHLKISDFTHAETVEVRNLDQLLAERIVRIEAQVNVNKQLLVELLALKSGRSMVEINTIAEKAYDHLVAKLIAELESEA